MAVIAPRKSLEPYLYDAVEYYPHQVEGIRRLAKMKSFLLADEMGLGKSLQALTVFAIDVSRGWANKCLIVCPATLKENWAEELEKFTRLPYTVLDGNRKEREQQLIAFHHQTGPKVLIINYEQVQAHLPFLNEIVFDAVIADEAHYLKNPKAKRTEAFHELRSHRSMLLSGTPFLNHINELWSLLYRIDPAAYPSYWSFLNRYAVFGGYKDKQIIGVKNEKELIERLQSVMVRRLKKDVLTLEEPLYIKKKVSLTPEQKEIYDEVMEELRLTTGDGSTLDVENALTKFLRLKQICGTTFTFTQKDNSGKLDQAVEDAIELMDNGHKIVVFTQFRDVLECFATRLEAAVPAGQDIWELHGDVPMKDRVGVVNAWAKHPQPSALVCMLQVAGLGLNMTASRHALFLDKLFVPGLNQQAVDRLHRIGQDETQPVMVFEYITRATIENRVEQINRTKSKLFDVVVETGDFKRKLIAALLEDEEEAA